MSRSKRRVVWASRHGSDARRVSVAAQLRGFAVVVLQALWGLFKPEKRSLRRAQSYRIRIWIVSLKANYVWRQRFLR